MADQYSVSAGNALNSAVSMDQSRRMFNFGERIAELAPQQSPFFVYLSKVAKKPTDDPVFKFLEQRHQWQRRNFEVETEIPADSGGDLYVVAGNGSALSNISIEFGCSYDKYGRSSSVLEAPNYFVVGQLVDLEVDVATATDGTGTAKKRMVAKVATVGASTARSGASEGSTLITVTPVSLDGSALEANNTSDFLHFADGYKGQVIGSAFAEGSTDPEGWKDELYDREGYVQIFKTAIPLFSGTAMATRYRGKSDEYKRVWQEKLMEHKMDIEHAMLYGIGRSDESASGPVRHSWGIMPYAEAHGYNDGSGNAFSYGDGSTAGAQYDEFLDWLKDFMSPESGNSGSKLVLASRKIIAWFNKIGDKGSFLGNTIGASSYRMDAQNIKGAFGHSVTKINTVFGDLHFIAEPLLRGMYEDTALVIDMKNVAYRPLQGNGVSRDTHIITNVQNNNVDGRKDIILTEAGLEVQLPETHAVLTFS